jgi:hypothetical protein
MSRWRALQWVTGAADRRARQTGFPATCVAKKEAKSPPAFALSDWKGRAELDDRKKL